MQSVRRVFWALTGADVSQRHAQNKDKAVKHKTRARRAACLLGGAQNLGGSLDWGLIIINNSVITILITREAEVRS